MKDNESQVKWRPARKKHSKNLSAQPKWEALYVQHKIHNTFKGRSQAENNPEQKVSDPHHGIRKLEARGEVN